jgi:hypothetical protein
MRSLHVAAVFIGLLSECIVHAQYMPGPPMPSGMQVGVSMDILWDDKPKGQRPQQKQVIPDVMRSKTLEYKEFNFTSSPDRTRANLNAMIEKRVGNNPEAAAKMRQVFASRDVLGSAGETLAALGLSRYNVAHSQHIGSLLGALRIILAVWLAKALLNRSLYRPGVFYHQI